MLEPSVSFPAKVDLTEIGIAAEGFTKPERASTDIRTFANKRPDDSGHRNAGCPTGRHRSWASLLSPDWHDIALCRGNPREMKVWPSSGTLVTVWNAWGKIGQVLGKLTSQIRSGSIRLDKLKIPGELAWPSEFE
ncbi:MAG: hypothetical protein M3490_07875 [Chloroflexota bacterium]|nr:hypothetical protein [Chloroflexota bacterium]